MIIDADDRACEGGDLSKGNEDGLVDLALRCEAGAEEEERDACEGKDGSGD